MVPDCGQQCLGAKRLAQLPQVVPRLVDPSRANLVPQVARTQQYISSQLLGIYQFIQCLDGMPALRGLWVADDQKGFARRLRSSKRVAVQVACDCDSQRLVIRCGRHLQTKCFGQEDPKRSSLESKTSRAIFLCFAKPAMCLRTLIVALAFCGNSSSRSGQQT